MREINIKNNQSIDRTAQILNCFSFDSQFQTLETIARLTKLPKASAYRLLYSLERHGLVYYNEADGTYSLGIKMLEFGGIVLERFSIRGIASPYLNTLHLNTGCMVLLGVIENDRLIYIDRRESHPRMGYTARIGGMRDPHRGILGKTLMAYLDDQKIDDLLNKFPLKKYTDQSIADPALMKLKLKEIRTKGYGIDIDETTMGTIGVALPIRNKWNQVIAAVSVVGPKDIPHTIPKLLEQVSQCVCQISEDMGAIITEQINFQAITL